jgi:hypothetical protein
MEFMEMLISNERKPMCCAGSEINRDLCVKS